MADSLAHYEQMKAELAKAEEAFETFLTLHFGSADDDRYFEIKELIFNVRRAELDIDRLSNSDVNVAVARTREILTEAGEPPEQIEKVIRQTYINFRIDPDSRFND